MTPEPPFPSYPNNYIQDNNVNNVHQNHNLINSNYPPPNQSQLTYNLNNQQQSIYNNLPPTGIQQYGNNQISMQTKAVPPTPPPHNSNNRCLTPSSIKSGIQYF